MEHDEEQNFPFDRVMIIGQLDGTWISVYIRRGFPNQQAALNDVGSFLGGSKMAWGEFEVESQETDLTIFLEEKQEQVKTELPEYMKRFWDEDDQL